MFEEEDSKRPYLPWAIFDELRDEKNCRYAEVGTWSRMWSRMLRKRFRGEAFPDPTIGELYEEIVCSRFGDVLAYLAKKEVTSDEMPVPLPWMHRIPPIHHLKVNPNQTIRRSHPELCGYGASYTSFTEALSKAIGEFLERYALLTTFFHRKNHITRKAFTDMHTPYALLHETPRFFDWQLKHVSKGLTNKRLKDRTNAHFHCVRGESLSSGKTADIPLQHIVWGPQYAAGTPDADTYRISPMTTSGAGGGFSLVDATLSGLCELIERDSFLVYWLNRLSPRRITISEKDAQKFFPRFFYIHHSLLARGFEIYFLDTTTDIRIPTVTSVVLETLPHGGKSALVAGKCHPDPARALELSLHENLPRLNLSNSNKETETFAFGTSYMPFSDSTIGRSERINMWRSGSIAHEMDLFLSGGEISFKKWAEGFPPPPNDNESSLSRVLNEFARMEKEHGPAYEVFRYEARNPILDDLEYCVVKMVVPALVPLYLRETLAFLDSARLRDVPKRLGFAAAPVNSYNPIPHPYP